MNRNAVLAAIPAVALATPALAAGTLAGTELINSAQINYQIGSVTQMPFTATDKVTVDRKIAFTISSPTPLPVTVTPNLKDVLVTVKITNTSNAPISPEAWVYYSAYNTFSTTNERAYWDTNGNGIYEPAIDQPFVTNGGGAANRPNGFGMINNPVLDPDTSITYFQISDIPGNIPNGDISTSIYWVQATEPNLTGDQVTNPIAATTGPNTAGVDTVLADDGSAWDYPYNGWMSFDGTYKAMAASLTVARTVKVISDPVNGSTDPKAIPGAELEYCVAVANSPTAATATEVNVADILDPKVTLIDGSIYHSGTVTNGACNADGIGGGTANNGTVSAIIDSIAAGETKALRYRAILN